MTASSSRGLSFLCGLFVVVVVVLVCFAFPYRSLAQTELAGVSGRITDQSGAVVLDAEVEIKNVETGISTTVKTNQDGLYTIPSLHPGHYLINVRKTGFRSVTVTELTLNVQDNVVRNFALQIGSVSETVTITADQLNINTTDATVSTVVDRQFAENLPMNGRSFQTLIQLTPGVILTPSNGFDGGEFSVNGQRASSNYWTVDGVSANIGMAAGFVQGNGAGGALPAFSAQGGTNSLVSVDALQEFRIQTSTYAPEFGRTPGGQISIVTRSGTNQYHGTAFDYFRNDVLDANDWFAGANGLPKPEERQNDFGGTFSGPILKDRTFFFFSYEGLRLRLPQVLTTQVPSRAARQSAIAAVQPFFNAYPLPGPSAPDNNGVSPFVASFSNKSSLDATSLRIDHRIGTRLSLFGRYNYSPSDLSIRGNAAPLSQVSPSEIRMQTATFGATWLISSVLANDLRFNYSRVDTSSHNTLDAFSGAVVPSIALPSPFNTQNGQFAFSVFGLSNGSWSDGIRANNRQQQINLVDSVSLQKGSHSLKFGVDYRRLSPFFGPVAYSQQAAFLDVPSAENGNLFFGFITANQGATLLFHNLGVFAQDTWRVHPRLTLTYGLRWDIDFAPSSSSGPSLAAVTGFNDLATMALAPSGTPIFNTKYGNVAPRIGAAYRLSGQLGWETVLRGGVGIFYDLATSEVGAALAGNYPFEGTKFLSGPAIGGTTTFPLSPSDAAPPVISPALLASPRGIVFAFDPNLKLPYGLEWNVATEQSLGKQQTLSLSYVGAAGRRLIQTAYLAQTGNPSFGTAKLVSNASASDYHSLQVQFQRRLSRGIQALASYVWAHSIDTGSAASVGNSSNLYVPDLGVKGNRGPSDFDIRHEFSAGFTYDVPSLKTNAVGRMVVRGWSVENVIQARSAPPVNVYSFLFGFEQLLNANTLVRPDVVAGQPFYLHGSQFPGGRAINAAAFTSPPVDPSTGAPLREGNLGRNALRGFGATQWDFAVHRDFAIHESLKLQFRAEMFNVLNHPNFGPPVGDLSGFHGQFGLSTQMLGRSLDQNVGGGSFSSLYQLGGPRSIQFALKLVF